MLPELTARRAVAEGRLVELLADHAPPPVACYAVFPSARNLSPAVRALIGDLARSLEKQPPDQVTAVDWNLKAFQGAPVFDEYAHHLRVFGEPILPEQGFLWAFRAIMLAAFIVHALLAWQTSNQSWSARDTKYKNTENLNFSFVIK